MSGVWSLSSLCRAATPFSSSSSSSGCRSTGRPSPFSSPDWLSSGRPRKLMGFFSTTRRRKTSSESSSTTSRRLERAAPREVLNKRLRVERSSSSCLAFSRAERSTSSDAMERTLDGEDDSLTYQFLYPSASGGRLPAVVESEARPARPLRPLQLPDCTEATVCRRKAGMVHFTGLSRNNVAFRSAKAASLSRSERRQ